jgi:hypothetical protein
MLKIKDMLTTHTNSLRTYLCMLIGQDMLISNMLISRFYCNHPRTPSPPLLRSASVAPGRH